MVLVYDYDNKIYTSELKFLKLFASNILMHRQLGRIEMLPYSILDEDKHWSISHRALQVRFAVTVSKPNLLNG